MPANILGTGVEYPITTPTGSTRTSGKWATRAIFGYGRFWSTGSSLSQILNLTNLNLVNNLGVVATDTSGLRGRNSLAAASYGGDKAIFGFGSRYNDPSEPVNDMNRVTNLGVIASEDNAPGAVRESPAAAGYGGDKAIFGYGAEGSAISITTLISNAGVIGGDVTGVGTGRQSLAAAGYGGDKAIFGFGFYENPITENYVYTRITNLVTNTGVVGSDISYSGTVKAELAAASYSS